MKDSPFSEDQLSFIDLFATALKEEAIEIAPAINKYNGEVETILIVTEQNGEDVEFYPIAVFFRPGSDPFEQYDFDVKQDVILERPKTFVDKVKSIFRKK